MHPAIRALTRTLAEQLDFPEPIWEIGAYQVPGQQDTADLRPFFPGREFIGTDMRPGHGVDRVLDITAPDVPQHAAGSILCLCTFEHVDDIPTAADNLYRLLKPGGLLFLAAPFNFPIHDHPHDYWRFTPDAMAYLARRFPVRLVGYHGHPLEPEHSFVVAFKDDCRDAIEPRVPALVEAMRAAVAHNKPCLENRVKLALARALTHEKYFRREYHRNDFDAWLVPADPAAD